MGKKYVPSGYVIINIDATDIESGGVLPLTDDVKLLLDIFDSKQIQRKPVLLHIKTAIGDYTGFCTSSFSASRVNLLINNKTDISLSYTDDNTLVFSVNEE